MLPKKNSPVENLKTETLLITGQAQKQLAAPSKAPAKPKAEKNNNPKEALVSKVSKKTTSSNETRIVVKCDCGFSNALFIRGEGIANLHWDKGSPLKNIKNDEWEWETDRPFVKAEFKILINDEKYELGENHKITSGSTVVCHPQFA